MTFDPPSSYSHTTHEIRYTYGGSCPGTSQLECASAGSSMSVRNGDSTNSVDIYYIQSGFPSADSDLNVVWTVSGESSTHFSRSSGQSRGAAV